MATIVGAYAASPASAAWKEAEEKAFYDGLKAMPGVRGLEVPFTGALHPHDEAWLLGAVKKDWDFVVTCIPGTMQTLMKDKAFGLASDDVAGRNPGDAHARGDPGEATVQRLHALDRRVLERPDRGGRRDQGEAQRAEHRRRRADAGEPERRQAGRRHEHELTGDVHGSALHGIGALNDPCPSSRGRRPRP